jgi:hypothetical protein
MACAVCALKLLQAAVSCVYTLWAVPNQLLDKVKLLIKW